MRRRSGILLIMVLLAILSSCGGQSSGDKLYGAFLNEIREKKAANVSGDSFDFKALEQDAVSYERTYRASPNPRRRLRMTGAFFNYMNDKMKYDAERFVRDHPDVEIVVTTYPSALSYREVFSVLLMSNSYGDVVSLPPEVGCKVLNQTYFLDLMPYINSEESLSQENYYMNILTANREGDSLYDLCLYPATLDHLMLRTNVAPEYAEIFTSSEDLHYNDLIEMYLEKSRQAKKQGKEWKTKFTPAFNPMEFLLKNIDSLIDFENKKAKFTDPEFMQLMEMVKNEVYYGDDLLFTENGMEWNRGAGMGKMDLEEVLREEEHYFFKGIYSFGFSEAPPFEGTYYTKPRHIPTAAGNYIFSPGYQFAINKNSPEKDLAWDFLMYLIEEQPLPPEAMNADEWLNARGRAENYLGRVGGATPVNKKNFDYLMDLQAAMFRIFCRNHYGAYPLQESFEDYYNALADYRRKAMGSFNKSKLFLNNLFAYYSKGILWDDMYLYLIDKQTVEQTMQNIENKVNIWLNE